MYISSTLLFHTILSYPLISSSLVVVNVVVLRSVRSYRSKVLYHHNISYMTDHVNLLMENQRNVRLCKKNHTWPFYTHIMNTHLHLNSATSTVRHCTILYYTILHHIIYTVHMHTSLDHTIQWRHTTWKVSHERSSCKWRSCVYMIL
jgi:hypothetical protein